MDLWLWFAFYPHTWAALVTVLAAGSPSTSRTPSAISCWLSWPGPSCGVCSTDTGAACTPRSYGREAASAWSSPRPCSAGAAAGCVRAGRRIRGVPRGPSERERRLCRAGSYTGRASDRLGGSRARRRRRLPRRTRRGRSSSCARARPTSRSDADLALRVVALAALGETIDEAVLARLRRHRPGVLVNETIWTVIALRAVGEQPPPALVQAIVAAQAKGGGFPWSLRRQPRLERHGRRDPGATGGRRRRRARATGRSSALRAFQNRDGGFALTKGRESDAQSTAWAIQALLSAGERPGKPPFRFLAPPAARRRQLPLFAPLRDDARLGHRTGAPCARRTPVSASLDRRVGSGRGRRGSTMQAPPSSRGSQHEATAPVILALAVAARLPGRRRRRQDRSGRPMPKVSSTQVTVTVRRPRRSRS